MDHELTPEEQAASIATADLLVILGQRVAQQQASAAHMRTRLNQASDLVRILSECLPDRTTLGTTPDATSWLLTPAQAHRIADAVEEYDRLAQMQVYHPTTAQLQALDALADHALEESRAGQTVKLEDAISREEIRDADGNVIARARHIPMSARTPIDDLVGAVNDIRQVLGCVVLDLSDEAEKQAHLSRLLRAEGRIVRFGEELGQGYFADGAGTDDLVAAERQRVDDLVKRVDRLSAEIGDVYNLPDEVAAERQRIDDLVKDVDGIDKDLKRVSDRSEGGRELAAAAQAEVEKEGRTRREQDGSVVRRLEREKAEVDKSLVELAHIGQYHHFVLAELLDLVTILSGVAGVPQRTTMMIAERAKEAKGVLG